MEQSVMYLLPGLLVDEPAGHGLQNEELPCRKKDDV